MLYADKAALANRARVRMIEIRERELNLYTQNSRCVRAPPSGSWRARLAALTARDNF